MEPASSRPVGLYKTVFSIALVVMLLATLYPAASLVFSSLGPAHRLYISMSVSPQPYYYVFIRNNTVPNGYPQSSALLYFIDRNMSVPLIPWTLAINPVCPINNTPFPNAPYIVQVYFQTNLTLPNGKKINTSIFFDDYMGCGHGKARIVAVSEDWKDKVLTFHVFVPVENASALYAPAILDSPASLVVYKYLNTTFFEADIVVYNASFLESFGLQSVHVRRYSFTFRFIVDERTWNAWYWDGREWVPCNYTPIALPIIDIRMLLYKFYKNYYENIHYYMTHPRELNLLVNKLKDMLKNGGTSEAVKYIRRMAHNLLPQLWPTLSSKWTYLGEPIRIGLGASVTSPKRFKFGIPGFTDYEPYPYDDEFAPPNIVNITRRLEPLLYKYIEEYLRTGNLDDLQRLVARYNGFIYYRTESSPVSGADGEWVTLQYLPMLTSWGLMMVLLPTETAEDIVSGHSLRYLYLEVSANGSAPIISFGIKGEPSMEKLAEKSGLECFSGVAIDSRLAREWLLTGVNAARFGNTINMLLNLMSVVENGYVNMWYSIITGSNPDEAMNSFLSMLKQSTIRTAESIGGEQGAAIMEYTIREDNPYTLPPQNTSAQTTTIPQAKAQPSMTMAPAVAQQETITHSVSPTKPSLPSSSGHGTSNAYLYYGLVAIVVLVALAVYIGSKRKR